MVGVIIKKDESIDIALRRFRKYVEKCGFEKDASKHLFFEKPSVINRRKRKNRRM